MEVPPIPADAANNEITKQSKTVVERLKYIKPGENAFNADLPDELKLNVRGAKISQIYKRLDPNIRILLHSKYSVNKQGFGNWTLSNYRIREGMSVLELGCGTGEMWCGKDDIIKRCGKPILSDFSKGMLETAKENLRDFPTMRSLD